MKKKVFALLIAFCFTAAMLTGCTSKEAAADSLVVALSYSPTSLDPVKLSTPSDTLTYHCIYDTLVDVSPDLKIIPKIAESWKTSEDGKTTTFQIRKGIKFHDGSDLTAEDVVFSINRYLKEPGAGLYYYSIFMKNAELVDKYTVNINTFNPSEVLLYNLSTNFFIVPKAYAEKEGNELDSKPIGSGPYKFVDWSKGSSLTLERNSSYFDSKSSIKDLKIKFIENPSTQAIALASGEVDFMINASTLDRSDLSNNKNVEFKEAPGSYTYGMSMYQSGALKDLRIRKAISLAINKQEIINIAMDGAAVPANSNISEQVFKAYEGSNNIQTNLDMSKKLLAEVGYTPEKYPITITTLEPVAAKVAQVVQAQLAQVGMKVDIQTIEYSAYIQQSKAGKIQMMLSQGGGAAMSATDAIFNYTTKGDVQNRFPHVSELDDAYDALIQETDREKVESLTKTALSIITENYVYIPLFAPYQNVAYAKGLKNVEFSPVMSYYIGDYTW